MTQREELLHSPEYWTTRTRIDLCKILGDYMAITKLTVAQMAKFADVKKSHVKAIIGCDFDSPIPFESLAKIALACSCAPIVNFKPINEVVEDDWN